MGIGKGKLDGGQGGKLGHSNQDHWEYTEEVKEAARKRRRLHAKKEIATALHEFVVHDEREKKNQNLDASR
jgi:hypothetical protein